MHYRACLLFNEQASLYGQVRGPTGVGLSTNNECMVNARLLFCMQVCGVAFCNAGDPQHGFSDKFSFTLPASPVAKNALPFRMAFIGVQHKPRKMGGQSGALQPPAVACLPFKACPLLQPSMHERRARYIALRV